MPIYDYQCQKCMQHCELLVMSNEEPVCPACGSADIRRLFTPTAAVSTTRSRERAMVGARRKAGVEKKDKDMAHAEYMRNHEKDHS